MNKVDVIIPLFNGAPWIRETLDSVLAQTCPVDKIIVVDDGSTDNSVEIVKEYSDVVFSRNPNKGASSAKNFGLEQSCAEYVAFLDQDDIWHKDHLRILAKLLDENKDVPAVLSGHVYFRDGETPILSTEDERVFSHDLWSGFPSRAIEHRTSAILFRRTVFQQKGGWSLRQYGQCDYELLTRISAGSRLLRSAAATLGYRSRPGSITQHLYKDIVQLMELREKVADDLLDYYLSLIHI